MGKPEIHQKWFQLASMAELAEYLQSAPSFELTKKVASNLSEQVLPNNPRRIVIQNFIYVTKGLMKEIFEELETDLEKHSYNYPFLMLRLPFLSYESTSGRETYQRIQSQLRKVPWMGRKYVPRDIRDPVVPIILPGVDYSAESLVDSSSLKNEKLPDKSKLGWQHLDAYADYCRGVMTIGRETYTSLMDAWYSGNDSGSYFAALETIAEEMLHHISDEIAGPRYSERSIAREHYWMKSYGEFPERLDIVLSRVKDDYLGKLKTDLSLDETTSPTHVTHLDRPRRDEFPA